VVIGNRRMMSALLPALVLALVVVATVPAAASDWAGHNGVIRLSFTRGDTLTSTLDLAPETPVGVMVDLYAVLTDVDQVHWNSGKVIALGGFELMLKAEGAEMQIMNTEYDEKCFDLGKEQGQCMVGFFPDLSLRDGPATLVHWKLLLKGDPRNVVFSLDPAGLLSCAGLPDCADSGSYALWAGSKIADQAGLLFSAGYTPAYLNWEGETDLSVVKGTGDWLEVGKVELKQ